MTNKLRLTLPFVCVRVGCHKGTPVPKLVRRMAYGPPFCEHGLRVLMKGSLVGLDYRGSMNAVEYADFVAKHGTKRKK